MEIISFKQFLNRVIESVTYSNPNIMYQKHDEKVKLLPSVFKRYIRKGEPNELLKYIDNEILGKLSKQQLEKLGVSNTKYGIFIENSIDTKQFNLWIEHTFDKKDELMVTFNLKDKVGKLLSEIYSKQITFDKMFNTLKQFEKNVIKNLKMEGE